MHRVKGFSLRAPGEETPLFHEPIMHLYLRVHP
jgi:hypothetical protein